MAKFTEYVVSNPDYYEYLKARISGELSIEKLSEEEI